MSIRLVIHGAAGRMGQRLVALGSQDSQLQIVAAIDSAQHPRLGSDAGLIAGIGSIQVPLTNQWPARADVAIDFSIPAACQLAIEHCLKQDLALVVATTGLEPRQVELVERAADQIPICWAPNMSLAVNLTMKLAQQAATALKSQQPDVEIIERHHRFKEDSLVAPH